MNRHSSNSLNEMDLPGFHWRQAGCRVRDVDFRFLSPLKPTAVFSTYWHFAVERQETYLRRLRGGSPPWSNDPVLRAHRFTNAYRAADRVSQYLVRHVIGEEQRSAEDTFFRVILFKIFNRIETWELLKEHIGEPDAKSFDEENYARVMDEAFGRGQRLYSAAYIMPSGGSRSGFSRKHRMHLNLLRRMLDDSLPARLAEVDSMAHAFGLLRAYPTFGDFLAYQYVIDLNYSTLIDFPESEFVMPGPGAKDGLRKCFTDFGGLSESDVIRLVTEHQEECLRALDLRFPTLWGRRLQLIDCQNLFCEVDKYSRVMHPDVVGKTGRTRIKQKLHPSTRPLTSWFPPKWGLNDRVNGEPAYVPRN